VASASPSKQSIALSPLPSAQPTQDKAQPTPKASQRVVDALSSEVDSVKHQMQPLLNEQAQQAESVSVITHKLNTVEV
jgi:uncharacterized protein YoxC